MELNVELGINWYLCKPTETISNYFCAQDVNECEYNFDSGYSEYINSYAESEECEEKEFEFNNEIWHLCKNQENYVCQFGLQDCEESVDTFYRFWACANELEKLQPTSDETTDVLFIPVNWRGTVDDFRFYAEIQNEVLLDTADLSGLDLDIFNLQVHYFEDTEFCRVPYIQSVSIDTRVVSDCINNIDLDFEFNPLKDKIIALTDDDMGNVLGFTSSQFPYLNIVKYERKATLAHELGHSSLNLCDEYSYYDWDRQNNDRDCPNPYPLCCLDNPDNRNNDGLNCYPENTPFDYAEGRLCQGTVCDPTNALHCRSVMGPGRTLREMQDYYVNSLEVKYLTWEIDEQGGSEDTELIT